MTALFTEQNAPDIPHEIDTLKTPNNSPLADSLDAVFDLLEMNDIHEQEVANEASAQSVTEIDQNEPKSIIDSPLDNPLNYHSSMLIELTEPKVPLIEFTDTEKKIMKQIDDIIPSGEHFMEWLKEAILTKKLIINEPQALVHTVDDTLFIITSGIFMRYVGEFPQVQKIAIVSGRVLLKAPKALKKYMVLSLMTRQYSFLTLFITILI